MIDPTVKPMRRVCSWCKEIMSDGTLPATHGCCPGCDAKMEIEIKALEGVN